MHVTVSERRDRGERCRSRHRVRRLPRHRGLDRQTHRLERTAARWLPADAIRRRGYGTTIGASRGRRTL